MSLLTYKTAADHKQPVELVVLETNHLANVFAALAGIDHEPNHVSFLVRLWLLLRQWGLPPSLRSVLRHHRNWGGRVLVVSDFDLEAVATKFGERYVQVIADLFGLDKIEPQPIWVLKLAPLALLNLFF